MMKRHEVQVLLKAGLPQVEVARLAGVSLRTVQRIQNEPAIASVDDEAERESQPQRSPGRVPKARLSSRA